MSRFINDELEISFDESGESDETDVEAPDERTDKQTNVYGDSLYSSTLNTKPKMNMVEHLSCNLDYSWIARSYSTFVT